jgi:hypothetical protein
MTSVSSLNYRSTARCFFLLPSLFVSIIWSILKFLHNTSQCLQASFTVFQRPFYSLPFSFGFSGALSIFSLLHLQLGTIFNTSDNHHSSFDSGNQIHHPSFLLRFPFSSISSPFVLKTPILPFYTPKSTPILEPLHLRLHCRSSEHDQ